MTENVTQENINNLDKQFNIRMFISDMPRVLNDIFKTIKNVILNIYDVENKTLKSKKGEFETVTTSTIITNNIALKGDNKTISYNELEQIKNDIVTLTTEIDNIKSKLGI